MSSILTNMSAMTAVMNLAATQKALGDTQNEISTGMKVSSAKDDAAYWSIATNMRTQNNDLTAVSSALNLGSSVLGTASSALNNMLTVMQSIQADVLKSQTTGVDKTAIQTDITQLLTQLSSTVSSASFNGVNLLDGSNSTNGISVVSGIQGSNSTVTSTSIAVAGYAFQKGDSTASPATADGAGATGVYELDVTKATDNNAANLATIGKAITAVQTASENIGATQKNIDIQNTFVSALSDSITTGIGSLVDADMNEASTRLNALQTQQQLGVQALSVANQNSQLILKLFNG